ncbi:MAG TPA: hypothetical protein VEA38_11185 [Terriglobales bacterium]|nr:hypothetical protein [Terriglobales bacterium]
MTELAEHEGTMADTEIIPENEFPRYLRKANARYLKRDADGYEIYRAGSGKLFRVIRHPGRIAISFIPGCGSCPTPGTKSGGGDAA